MSDSPKWWWKFVLFPRIFGHPFGRTKVLEEYRKRFAPDGYHSDARFHDLTTQHVFSIPGKERSSDHEERVIHSY